MPYIPFEQRQEVRQNFVDGHGIQEPGELAYIISDALSQFVGGQFSYARLATALGAVESAVAEFNRRVIQPYEDGKLAENGDVYTGQQTGGTSGVGFPD